jgi:putative ABC transport system permease protein
MHFLPILASLRRHRTAAALIIVEIALTCAIVCNAVFLIGDRLNRMERSSGVVEDELLRVDATGIGEKRDDAWAITVQDLNALRAIPGVKSTASTNMVPLTTSSWNSGISTKPKDPTPPLPSVGVYMGSQDLLETWGMSVTMGRDFTPEEYIDFEASQGEDAEIAAVILTRGAAEVLFPGQSPIGKSVYVAAKHPQTVVGVIDRIIRPGGFRSAEEDSYAVVLPINVPYTRGSYLVRTDPSRRAEVLAATDAALLKVNPNRIIDRRDTFTELRIDYFKQDRAMAWLLGGVCLALLIITALGVVGLASFWVQQRTRQIGVRRALGATRGDILRYFQTENFILATLGIVLGMAMAYAMNLVIMSKYHVGRLPAEYLPIGAALLWALGQIAVLGPALRAASIPPAIATRTV